MKFAQYGTFKLSVWKKMFTTLKVLFFLFFLPPQHHLDRAPCRHSTCKPESRRKEPQSATETFRIYWMAFSGTPAQRSQKTLWRGYCCSVLWRSQYLESSPVTYLGVFDQPRRSPEMVQCHHKCLQSFVRLQVATLKPGCQEPQDLRIADLSNHVQKPTSGRQKTGGVMQQWATLKGGITI